MLSKNMGTSQKVWISILTMSMSVIGHMLSCFAVRPLDIGYLYTCICSEFGDGQNSK